MIKISLDDETEIALLPLGSEMIIAWVKHPNWMNRVLNYIKELKQYGL